MTQLVSIEKCKDVQRVARLYTELRHRLPETRRDLKNYVKIFLGIDVPDKRLCPDHSSPMDYLWHSFALDTRQASGISTGEHRASSDAIVWANRTGGKTELAAVATLLDCVLKPDCQVRILGGSGKQAGRMYEYLRTFLHNRFESVLAGPVLKNKCRFTNGSSVEVLTQSSTSVRGQHIQKLRCDELELFDEDVFAAAKFTTQSKSGITASMELISTMHRPYGLMQKVVACDRGMCRSKLFAVSLMVRLSGQSKGGERLPENRRLHHTNAPSQSGGLGGGNALFSTLAGQRRFRRV